MKKLLWKLCGFEARAKQQKLRSRCMNIICMDDFEGWLETYSRLALQQEVRA